ncbi:MAG: MmcQ/YjbR family DNA-binding protein [Sphingobacteriaceae bacterium]|jgi:predicted DNA-binding protein (MmcQ/YjbR family)|nr:MmcQ/YjbR family DNA-binding protein [Sphingobacteriaceae bacterium]
MDIKELRDYCLSKNGVTEGFPFDENVLVFKVGGKMFLLAPLDSALQMNVKCDPELAMQLREQYPEIQPGYHMNKKLWNTVELTGSLTRKQILEFIDHSYNLIVSGLPKSLQAELQNN